MSEYPVNCLECGIFLGYVHATRYSSNYVCEECYKKIKRKIEFKKQ